MKLVRAHVQNYRSVEDSTEFRIDGGTTCLVGKNESGKTALLTALHRLNPVVAADAIFDRQRDYPRRYLADYEERHSGVDAVIVRTWWTLEEIELEKARVLLGRAAITGASYSWRRATTTSRRGCFRSMSELLSTISSMAATSRRKTRTRCEAIPLRT